MRIFLALTFLVSSAAIAGNPINEPQLLFDYPDHLSSLESCIVNDVVSQSPDQLTHLVPSGTLRYAMDASGKPIKQLSDMLAVGFSQDGRRLPYKLRFSTVNSGEWLFFQSGQLYGMYAPSMIPVVAALDFRTGKQLFVVDVTNCQ
jgi:hypothetical protein